MSGSRKRSTAATMPDDGSDDSSAHGSRRESRKTVVAGAFKEAESDDEFANEHFCLPSKKDKSHSSKKNGKKSKKISKKRQEKSEESGSDSDSSVDEVAGGPEYRIEFILGSKVCSPAQWREIGDGMNTYEVTRGSVWQQPDEEYFCDHHGQTADIVKYLIKWQHASFIHCSWETEKDLMEMCHGSSGSGDTVKNTHVSNHLKKFLQRCAAREDLWEDLGATEWFLPSFTTVERVLDVDDRENPTSVQDMDWRHAVLPPRELLGAPEAEETELDRSNQSCLTDDDETALVALLMDGESPSAPEEEEGGVDSMLTGAMFMSPRQEGARCEDGSEGALALTGVFDEDGEGKGRGEVDAWDAEKESDFLDVLEEEGLLCGAEEAEECEGGDEAPAADSAPRGRTREPKQPAAPAPEPTRQSTRRRNSSTKAQEAAADAQARPEQRSGRTHKTRAPRAAKEQKKASSRKSRSSLPIGEVYLHSNSCWLTIKWAGLTYSQVSQEDVNDLRSSFFVGEEAYTEPLRQFFRREQMVAVDKHPPRRQLQEASLTKTIAQIKALEQHTAKLALAEEAGEGAAAGEEGAADEPNRLVLGGNLRDYQWEGVKWLLFNYSQRRNSILADEMGLGKTIQSAAFLQLLKSNFSLRGPFLVVAPLSTIVQWQREISQWTDLDVVIYHGSQEDRQLIRDLEFRYVGGLKKDRKEGFKVEVVVTTPETAIAFDVAPSATGTGRPTSKRVLSQGIFWEMVIIDEAHKLKNSDSRLTTVLKDEYSYRNCLLLTGTPIQNNTEELYTLLNFVDKERFRDKAGFMSEFGNISEFAQLSKLHDKLRPYILRREKDNVEKTVPPKEEVVIEVELTVVQKQYYRAIYEQNTAFLYKGQARDGPRLSNLAMELRKCCLHPFLIKGAQTELSKHFDSANGEYTTLETLINTSGKLTLLDKLLPKLQADGHRVLIFSQFRMMLDLIEDYLYNKKCFTYDRIDGSITGRKRQAAIDRYMGRSRSETQLLEDGSPAPPQPEIFCMLLSTRAGGVGINLTAADTVILFDSDWNPQNDLQAQARAHRIGQTRFVKVYRLLTRGTYEMLMFKAASMKLGLDYAVMNGCNAANATKMMEMQQEQEQCKKRKGRQSAAASVNALDYLNTAKDATSCSTASSLSKRELEYLLKHGAYDMFKEEKEGEAEAASKRFSEESIDDILQRSAMFSHADPAAGGAERTFQQGQGARGFSKASFVMGGEMEGADGQGQGNSNYDDIDINDDDFWNKVVGLASGLNDEDGEDAHRSKQQRRNCRAKSDGFYKEPTASIARLLQENDSDSDGEGSSRRVLAPIEWTDVQCNKLLQVLATNGGYPSEAVPVVKPNLDADVKEGVDADAAEAPEKMEDEDEQEQILEGWDLIGHEFKVPRGVKPVPLTEIRTMSQRLLLQLLYNSFRNLLPAVGSGGCALAITQATVGDKPQSQVQLASVSSRLYSDAERGDAVVLSEFELAIMGHLRRHRAARTALFDLLAAAEGAAAGDIAERLVVNAEWQKLCIGGPAAEEGLAVRLLRDDGYWACPAPKADDADADAMRDLVCRFVTLVESFGLPLSFTSAVALPSSVAASASATDLTAVTDAVSEAVPVQAVVSSINRWSRSQHHRLLLLEDLYELHLLRRFSGGDIIRDDVVRGVHAACCGAEGAAEELEATRCLLQDLDDVQYYHLLADSYSQREVREKEKEGKEGVRRKKEVHCAAAVQAARDSGAANMDLRALVRRIKDALSVVRGTFAHDKVVAEQERVAREKELEEQLAAAALRAARLLEEKAEKEAQRAQEKAEKEAARAAAAAEKAAAAVAREAMREAQKEQKQAELQAAQEQKNNRRFVMAVVKSLARYGRPRALYEHQRARHLGDACVRQLDSCLIDWVKLYRLVEQQTKEKTATASGDGEGEETVAADTEEAVDSESGADSEATAAVDPERMARVKSIVQSVLELQSDPRSIYTSAAAAQDGDADAQAQAAPSCDLVFDTSHPLFPVCNTTASGKTGKGKDTDGAAAVPVPGSQPLSVVLPCVDGLQEKMDFVFRMRAVLLVFGSNCIVDHEAGAVSSNLVTNSINSAAATASNIATCDSEAVSASAPRLEVEWSDMTAFIRGVAKFCTGSGPSTPAYKRDATLPAWWTVFHDFCLLRGLETIGHREYKLLADTEFVLTLRGVPCCATAAEGEEPRVRRETLTLVVTLSRAFPSFEMPAKEPGSEWILDITNSVGRVFDKRATLLVKGLFASGPCQSYLQDFYREVSAEQNPAESAGLPPLSPMVATAKADKKGKAPAVSKLSFGASTGVSSASFSKFFSAPVTTPKAAPAPVEAVTAPAPVAPAVEAASVAVDAASMVVDLVEDEEKPAVEQESKTAASVPVAEPEPVPAKAAEVSIDLTEPEASALAESVPAFPPKTPCKPEEPLTVVVSPATITTGIDSAVKPSNPAPAVAKKRPAAPTASSGATLTKKQKLAAGAKQTASLFSFFKKPAADPAPVASADAEQA